MYQRFIIFFDKKEWFIYFFAVKNVSCSRSVQRFFFKECTTPYIMWWHQCHQNTLVGHDVSLLLAWVGRPCNDWNQWLTHKVRSIMSVYRTKCAATVCELWVCKQWIAFCLSGIPLLWGDRHAGVAEPWSLPPGLHQHPVLGQLVASLVCNAGQTSTCRHIHV